MAKIIRAEVLGFCMGVRRAVDLAYSELDRVKAATATRVCTLGPLIHNPHVINELASRGVVTLDEGSLPSAMDGDTVIIRAHGISPVTEEALRKSRANIVDATCPRVKASQLKAASFAKNGCRLFLAGESMHAEILALKGYAPGCIVAGSVAEADAAAKELHLTETNAKTALIAQTTISREEYRAIGEAIAKYFPALEVADTICSATFERQQSLRNLLANVDAVIIAGGKESANTRRLLAIAQEAGKPCALAESVVDIPANFAGFARVGLCAGASTPDSVIDAIELQFEAKCDKLKVEER